jgi:hypothetical protein
MATVNDGNLAECLASAALYLLVRSLRTSFNWTRTLSYLGCVLGAILSKTTAFFLIPLTIIVGLEVVWRRGGSAWLQKPGAWKGVLLVIALSLAGLFLVARSEQAAYLGRVIGPNLNALDSLQYYVGNLQARGELSLTEALWRTFRSFWLTFGWMSLSLPEAVYQVLLALSLLAGVGLGRRALARPRWPETASTVMGLAAGLNLVITLLLFIVSSIGYPYQGRYLFGSLVPMGLFLVQGWLNLAPPRQTHWVLWAIAAGLLTLDGVSLGMTAIPFYYGA